MNYKKDIQILIAEDNPNIRKLLSNILQNLGFINLVLVEDGVQAWEAVQSNKFDLIMTDWNMPNLSGLELLTKVRSGSQEIKKTPILMITASDNKDKVISALKHGVTGYIVKPFSVKTIVSKISELFPEEDKKNALLANAEVLRR